MRSIFAHEPQRGDSRYSVRALVSHRFLLRFALAGVNVFAWLFVFQFFYYIESDIAYALLRTTLLYTLSQIITCLATPLTARSLGGGARRMMLWGVLLAAASLIALGAAFEGFWEDAYIGGAIAFFAFGTGLYRAFYWIPYQVEAVSEGKKKHLMVWEILIALAPCVAGLFIMAFDWGPVWILCIGGGIALLSMIPAFHIRDVYEKFSWKYRETFVHLFRIENRAVVVGSFLEGISGSALLFFWPLVIFLIVDASYGMLGIILSLTFLIAILTRGFVRKVVRKLGLTKSPSLNVIFAVSPWLFRIAVGGPFAIILTDSYFYTTTPRRLGVDPLASEQAADGAHYIDEYTALKEIALALGRIVISLAAVALFAYLSVPAAFVSIFLVAALSSASAALWLRAN